MASGAKCCFVTFFGKYAVQKLMMDIFTISCRKLGKHLVSSPVSFKRSKLLCLINAQFTVNCLPHTMLKLRQVILQREVK